MSPDGQRSGLDPELSSGSVSPLATAVEVRPLPDALDFETRAAALCGCRGGWWLDSARPMPGLGQWSFAGADPWAWLQARGRHLELTCRRAAHPGLEPGLRRGSGDPLEALRAWLPPRRPSEDAAGPLPPFVGGAVAQLGYELGALTEGVALAAPDDLGLPDVTLLFVDRLLARDHVRGRTLAVGLGMAADPGEARARARRAAEAMADSSRPVPAPGPAPAAPARPSDARIPAWGAREHATAVDRILREIGAGNVYQANLTHRLELPPVEDPVALYRALRRVSPAPFGCLLRLPGFDVLGSSPERFLRLDGKGRVESRPIKGTRPRAAEPERDRALARDLAACPKDRAENLMIVDLVRNDLGRVCEAGSIGVPRLMEVESYAQVHQLVSTVTGCLAVGRDRVDLLRACFPSGSMTGAPKIAAMELIDRLEPVRRGVYSGAIGYLDLRGGLDLSVVIRTLVACGERLSLHVGGGIVADSEAASEWRESLDKARGPLRALDLVHRMKAGEAEEPETPPPAWPEP